MTSYVVNVMFNFILYELLFIVHVINNPNINVKLTRIKQIVNIAPNGLTVIYK